MFINWQYQKDTYGSGAKWAMELEGYTLSIHKFDDYFGKNQFSIMVSAPKDTFYVMSHRLKTFDEAERMVIKIWENREGWTS